MENSFNFPAKLFHGHISHGDGRVDVDFTVMADAAGEFAVEFVRFPLDDKSAFLQVLHNIGGTTFPNLLLEGAADDGAYFSCDNLIITSLKEKYDGSVRTIAPLSGYSVAELHFKQASDIVSPSLSWQIKGFKSHRVLREICSLGEVTMAGLAEKSAEDVISGKIIVQSPDGLTDVAAWADEADELLDHVRHVMSLATGVFILVPSRTLNFEGMARCECYSQNAPDKLDCPILHWLNLGEIFSCAVRSFFAPKINVKNLKFAIKWYTMRANYTEGLLIASMTVLENLLDSNLDDADTHLMSESQHRKLRRKIRCVIESEVGEWNLDEVGQIKLMKDLTDRLVDLKRRSLLDKLLILAERWGVGIDDISVEEIQLAKKVRDHVVHRGHYQSKNESDGDVHDQVLVVRELVARFLLTALGFTGTYFSYRGGYHMRELKMQ